MTIRYVARRNGEIIGRRRSDSNRCYSHAIAVQSKSGADHIAIVAWCGRLDLAQKQQREWQRRGYTVEILEAEIVPPRRP